MPGFGPLDPADAERLFAQMIGADKSADASAALPGAESDSSATAAAGNRDRRDETATPVFHKMPRLRR